MSFPPFLDLHVHRDGTYDLTLYGDDGEAIDPDPALLRWAWRQVAKIVTANS